MFLVTYVICPECKQPVECIFIFATKWCDGKPNQIRTLLMKLFLQIITVCIMIFGASALLLHRKRFTNSKALSMIAEGAKTMAKNAIKENDVMVFSKSYCPFCTKTKRTLEGLGIKYGVLELDVSWIMRTLVFAKFRFIVSASNVIKFFRVLILDCFYYFRILLREQIFKRFCWKWQISALYPMYSSRASTLEEMTTPKLPSPMVHSKLHWSVKTQLKCLEVCIGSVCTVFILWTVFFAHSTLMISKTVVLKSFVYTC